MRNVKQYQVLISAPSDVKDELEAIYLVIEDFNRGFGYIMVFHCYQFIGAKMFFHNQVASTKFN